MSSPDIIEHLKLFLEWAIKRMVSCLFFCLLFSKYSFSFLVDIWSVGCIFDEMIRGQVIFPGSDRKILSIKNI
jgi:serine/threonine protein kinase